MSSIVDRYRRKLETMEDILHSKTAKLRSKLKTTRVGVFTQSGGYAELKSSWVRSFAYDDRSQILYMTTHSGKTYSWNGIPATIADQCINGEAWCITNDPNTPMKWWVGKHRSLGAAYWHILKPFAMSAMATQAASPSNIPRALLGSYADIATEGYEAKYNVDVTKKVGRPTKSETKARDFAWSGRYKKPIKKRVTV